ncbi:MAG TPA: hypothetical protein VNQ99_14930 [Xanthobacteraceae bacterium]|nr:hypothetical protein [Xanthobacteraceae bacterium]
MDPQTAIALLEFMRRAEAQGVSIPPSMGARVARHMEAVAGVAQGQLKMSVEPVAPPAPDAAPKSKAKAPPLA